MLRRDDGSIVNLDLEVSGTKKARITKEASRKETENIGLKTKDASNRTV